MLISYTHWAPKSLFLILVFSPGLKKDGHLLPAVNHLLEGRAGAAEILAFLNTAMAFS